MAVQSKTDCNLILFVVNFFFWEGGFGLKFRHSYKSIRELADLKEVLNTRPIPALEVCVCVCVCARARARVCVCAGGGVALIHHMNPFKKPRVL